MQQPKGLGVRKKQMSAAALIPGLKVSVDGTSQDATHVLAKSITFDKDDLQTAEMIQAGLNPTEQKVAANQQNIAENKQNIAANKQATARYSRVSLLTKRVLMPTPRRPASGFQN